MIQLPTGAVGLHDAIISGGNFSWAEATKGGQRIPQSSAIVNRIIFMAGVMQEVRGLLGNRSTIITSWYRDPATNRRVGGASRSSHLNGDAVDFAVTGLSTAHVYRQLDPWWGSRGGLASASPARGNFTHIDARGVRARWDY